MKGIYAIKVAFKALFEIIRSKEGRFFLKLCIICGDRKRHKPGRVTVHGRKISYVDSMSFLWQYWEIFHKQYYHFKSDKNNPVIFDCGANIGLASRYFLNVYPQCRLIAFEPDPSVAQVYLSNVPEPKVFYQKAVWVNDAGVRMVREGADAGFISTEGDMVVESISLKDELMKFPQIDMLKMDIEGAESDVMMDIKPELSRVQNMFIEYHDRKDREQTLGKLLDTLEQAGFKYQLTNEDHYMLNPFGKIRESSLQVNIFASRLGLGN
jgi:FkbM family methyltransferase